MLSRECLEEFRLEMQLRRLSHRTIKGYYNNTALFLTYLENQLGESKLEKIKANHIKLYIQYLIERDLSPSYANGILKCLRAFFKYAVGEEYIASSPMEKVNWQREGKVIIQTFSDEEVTKMLEVYPTTSFLSARNKLILAVAFDTGIRNSELCEITKQDVTETVILVHGKGNKERNVPITPYIKRCMMKYIRLRDWYFQNRTIRNDRYFLSRTGQPLTTEAVEIVFKKAGEIAGVRSDIRCSPHTARHYYAQANIRNGLDVYSLSRLLGHENINITKRYLQSLQDSSIVELATASSPISFLNLK